MRPMPCMTRAHAPFIMAGAVVRGSWPPQPCAAAARRGSLRYQSPWEGGRGGAGRRGWLPRFVILRSLGAGFGGWPPTRDSGPAPRGDEVRLLSNYVSLGAGASGPRCWRGWSADARGCSCLGLGASPWSVVVVSGVRFRSSGWEGGVANRVQSHSGREAVAGLERKDCVSRGFDLVPGWEVVIKSVGLLVDLAAPWQ